MVIGASVMHKIKMLKSKLVSKHTNFYELSLFHKSFFKNKFLIIFQKTYFNKYHFTESEITVFFSLRINHNENATLSHFHLNFSVI